MKGTNMNCSACGKRLNPKGWDTKVIRGFLERFHPTAKCSPKR